MGVLAFQAKDAVEAGVKAGLTVLESSILGAIAILAITISTWAVYKLSKVQDKRVADQVAMNDKMERLIEKMTTAFSEMNNSLYNLVQAEKDGQALMSALKTSVDGIIMEAIRRIGPSYGPPPVPRGR